MQFMPATWAAYGLGGDIHDPRDAILGAANYLRANGAPGESRRALYHYNPSQLYVEATSPLHEHLPPRPARRSTRSTPGRSAAARQRTLQGAEWPTSGAGTEKVRRREYRRGSRVDAVASSARPHVVRK